MKVTTMEEIETHKAWSNRMTCPRCDEFIYKIHHQIIPETSNCWWVECFMCKYETEPAPDRKIAISRWKHPGSF